MNFDNFPNNNNNFDHSYDQKNELKKVFNYNNIYFVNGNEQYAAYTAINMYLTLLPQFIMKKYRNVILISAIEYKLINKNLSEELSERGYNVIEIPCETNGIISYDELEKLLETHKGNVAMVSIMGVNNETGIIQPISRFHNLVKQYDSKTIFYSDFTYGINLINKINKSIIISFSGSLWQNNTVSIILANKDPVRNLNLVNVINTWNTSIDIFIKQLFEYLRECNRIALLNINIHNYIIQKLYSDISTYSIQYGLLSSNSPSSFNHEALILYGYDSQLIKELLFHNGIKVNAVRDSHVLKAMGYSDQVVNNMIRISLNNISNINNPVTIHSIDLLISNLRDIILKLKPIVNVPKHIFDLQNNKIISNLNKNDISNNKSNINLSRTLSL